MLTSSVFQDKRILFACNRPFDGPVQLIARECKSALGIDTVSRPLQRAVSSRARLPPSQSGSGIEMTMMHAVQSVPPSSALRRDTFDDESEETLSPVDLNGLIPPLEIQDVESGNRRTPPTNRNVEEPTPLEDSKSGMPSLVNEKPSEVESVKMQSSENTISPIMIDRVVLVDGNESQTTSVTQPALSERVTIPFKVHEKRNMQHVILRDYVFCVGVVLLL